MSIPSSSHLGLVMQPFVEQEMTSSDKAVWTWTEAMKDAAWSDSVITLQCRDVGIQTERGLLAERDAWWHQAFDQTLGFLGEGPAQVQPITEARYRLRVAALEAWLAEQGLPSLKQFAAYIQTLHNGAAPISYESYGTWALAGTQYVHPAINGHLTNAASSAWMTQRQWQRLVPSNMRPPLPSRLLRAMAVTAWCLDWTSLETIMFGFADRFPGIAESRS
eukprot:2838634-Amphidinium_carterae.2